VTVSQNKAKQKMTAENIAHMWSCCKV